MLALWPLWMISQGLRPMKKFKMFCGKECASCCLIQNLPNIFGHRYFPVSITILRNVVLITRNAFSQPNK
jgi:hypothetical protein